MMDTNCRWVTVKQNARNRRTNCLLEIRGEKKCITECAEEFNTLPSFIMSRYNRGTRGEELFSKKRLNYKSVKAGEKYGYLTAIRLIKDKLWLFKCKCGKEIRVQS